jgi:transcriptional regulator GlxA family with amidase domain
VDLCDRLEAARKRIARHPSKKICTQELARDVNLSLAHFTRLFALTYGRSPAQYRSEIRLQHARVMLQHGSTVAETARKLGYSSASTFARLYRTQFGESPRQTRPRN